MMISSRPNEDGAIYVGAPRPLHRNRPRLLYRNPKGDRRRQYQYTSSSIALHQEPPNSQYQHNLRRWRGKRQLSNKSPPTFSACLMLLIHGNLHYRNMPRRSLPIQWDSYLSSQTRRGILMKLLFDNRFVSFLNQLNEQLAYLIEYIIFNWYEIPISKQPHSNPWHSLDTSYLLVFRHDKGGESGGKITSFVFAFIESFINESFSKRYDDCTVSICSSWLDI